MTKPVDLTEIVPSKAKAWVGLFGSLVTFSAPFVLETATSLPEPWPAIVGIVFALLTALGVYKAPYKPAGTTLAVDPHADHVDTLSVPSDAPIAVPTEKTPQQKIDDFKNPWR